MRCTHPYNKKQCKPQSCKPELCPFELYFSANKYHENCKFSSMEKVEIIVN